MPSIKWASTTLETSRHSQYYQSLCRRTSIQWTAVKNPNSCAPTWTNTMSSISNQIPQPRTPIHIVLLPFLIHQSLKIAPIDILRRVPLLLVKDYQVAVPLPDPILRSRFLMESDTDAVFSNGHWLTGVRLEGLDGVRGMDDPDDLLLELRLFLGKEAPFLRVHWQLVIIVGIGAEVRESIVKGGREKSVGVVEEGVAEMEAVHEVGEEHGIDGMVGGHGRGFGEEGIWGFWVGCRMGCGYRLLTIYKK